MMLMGGKSHGDDGVSMELKARIILPGFLPK